MSKVGSLAVAAPGGRTTHLRAYVAAARAPTTTYAVAEEPGSSDPAPAFGLELQRHSRS